MKVGVLTQILNISVRIFPYHLNTMKVKLVTVSTNCSTSTRVSFLSPTQASPVQAQTPGGGSSLPSCSHPTSSLHRPALPKNPAFRRPTVRTLFQTHTGPFPNGFLPSSLSSFQPTLQTHLPNTPFVNVKNIPWLPTASRIEVKAQVVPTFTGKPFKV